MHMSTLKFCLFTHSWQLKMMMRMLIKMKRNTKLLIKMKRSTKEWMKDLSIPFTGNRTRPGVKSHLIHAHQQPSWNISIFKNIVFTILYRIFQFQIHISILSSNIFPSIICLSPDLANFFDLKFLFAILIWIYLLRGEWNICPHIKYLIFWIVMGCGIAGFGRSCQKNTKIGNFGLKICFLGPRG